MDTGYSVVVVSPVTASRFRDITASYAATISFHVLHNSFLTYLPLAPRYIDSDVGRIIKKP
jgi:hypothetical protein